MSRGRWCRPRAPAWSAAPSRQARRSPGNPWRSKGEEGIGVERGRGKQGVRGRRGRGAGQGQSMGSMASLRKLDCRRPLYRCPCSHYCYHLSAAEVERTGSLQLQHWRQFTLYIPSLATLNPSRRPHLPAGRAHTGTLRACWSTCLPWR